MLSDDRHITETIVVEHACHLRVIRKAGASMQAPAPAFSAWTPKPACRKSKLMVVPGR